MQYFDNPEGRGRRPSGDVVVGHQVFGITAGVIRRCLGLAPATFEAWTQRRRIDRRRKVLGRSLIGYGDAVIPTETLRDAYREIARYAAEGAPRTRRALPKAPHVTVIAQ